MGGLSCYEACARSQRHISPLQLVLGWEYAAAVVEAAMTRFLKTFIVMGLVVWLAVLAVRYWDPWGADDTYAVPLAGVWLYGVILICAGVILIWVRQRRS